MNTWKEKMITELNDTIDEIVSEGYRKIGRELDYWIAEYIRKLDSAVIDITDQYADGVSQEDITATIIQAQCSAELALKKSISEYVSSD